MPAVPLAVGSFLCDSLSPIVRHCEQERKVLRQNSCTESHILWGRKEKTTLALLAGGRGRPPLHWQGQRKQGARIILVRHRSHATFSRQPRQVRKEATVTGSDVCSESPVLDLFFPPPTFTSLCTSDYRLLHA